MNETPGYETYLERGRLLRELGRPKDASDCARRAIAAEPYRAIAYLDLALSLSDLRGQKKPVLEAMDRALALDPNSAQMVACKAFFLTYYKRHNEALEWVNRALKLDPDSYIALAAQAMAYSKLGHWVLAEWSARRLLEFNPDDTGALNMLAQALRHRGQHEASRRLVAQILALSPDDAFGQFNAGAMALKTNARRLARRHFLESLRINPNHEYARLGLLRTLRERAWIYRMLGKITSAFSEYYDRSVFVLTVLVLFSLFLGRWVQMSFVSLCFLTAAFHPLANLLLWFDPAARHVLTKKECRWAGAISGAILLLFGALLWAKWDRLCALLAGCVASFAVLFAFSMIMDTCRGEAEGEPLAESDRGKEAP